MYQVKLAQKINVLKANAARYVKVVGSDAAIEKALEIIQEKERQEK